MNPVEYRAKAMLHMELAEQRNDAAEKDEHVRLALSYMRLAEAAEKNAKTDIFYETPGHEMTIQAVQEPQQQQQQSSSEEKPRR
jgi:hypothetical protein